MKPQTSGLLFGKLKHKVLREPVGVALNGKIQGFGGNTVEFGQVCIEHDLLAADQKYSSRKRSHFAACLADLRSQFATSKNPFLPW